MILSYDDLSGVGGSMSLIRHEIEYFDARGQIAVFCEAPKQPVVKLPNPIFFVHPKLPLRSLSLIFSELLILLKLIRHSKTTGVRVYHAHDVYIGFPAAIAAKLLGIRLVLTVHGPASYEFANFYRKRFNQFKFSDMFYLALLSILEKFAYMKANAVVAVSDFERRFIEKLRRRNLFVVRNGVDLNMFRPTLDKQETRRSIGLPTDKRIITFVGRMVPKNGVLIIAQAIPLVTEARKDRIFVFVGDGFATDDCKDIVNLTGVASNVIFVGRRSRPLPYYQASDLFVSHVSSLVEGVGLTVYEAMSCGLPVIVGSDRVSCHLLSDVAYFVEKDSPSVLAKEITRVLSTVDFDKEKIRMRMFAEEFLDLRQTLETYDRLLFEGFKD